MFERVTIYCDCGDTTIGPYIEGPDIPAFPPDVFIVAQYALMGSGPRWVHQPVALLADRAVQIRHDGGLRWIFSDGSAMPLHRNTNSPQMWAAITGHGGAVGEVWSPICARCRQTGGDWTGPGRDELFDKSAARGITGVSLVGLAALQHAD